MFFSVFVQSSLGEFLLFSWVVVGMQIANSLNDCTSVWTFLFFFSSLLRVSCLLSLIEAFRCSNNETAYVLFTFKVNLETLLSSITVNFLRTL